MAYLLDGRLLAARIREKMKTRVQKLSERPGLAVLLVGADPASHTYVGIKQKACEEVGIRFERFAYEATVTEEFLIQKIHALNARKDIHGVLVQLPLPAQQASQVIEQIDPLKDVDGFHPVNLVRLREGKPTIVSAVALGIMKLIDEAIKQGFVMKQASLVCRPLFAQPLRELLKERALDTHLLAPSDPDLATKLSVFDLVVVAVGKPGFITGRMIKPGAVVIDVGTTKVDGVLLGDVDRASVFEVAGALSPVPGGVGPLTVAMLLVNVLKAYDLQQRNNLIHQSADK